MTEFIQGRCLLMCPGKERRIREEKGLLHRFEIDENTKGTGDTRAKADPKKTIKCFSRSAAGVVFTDPDQLRPASVLLSTVKYLFTKIATRTDVDWIVVYDFIFDRLRSIRQDAIVQRIENSAAGIKLFESIVRFLVYAAQRLCERNESEFSKRINNQHLAECITELLTLYDQKSISTDEFLPIDRRLATNAVVVSTTPTNNNDCRQQMEALYILLYMGATKPLKRALNLPLYIRRCSDVQLSMKISLACYLKNYVRVFSLIQQLAVPILVCAATINVPKLRRMALEIMSSGYNSKICTFPGLKLQELLSYKDINKVEEDCKLFGLVCIDENVLFQKSNFKRDVEVANSETYYTQRILHHFLPHILLESI